MPATLAGLVSLTTLGMSGNPALTLPDASWMANLASLTALRLSGTSLGGTIPAALASLTSLQWLSLASVGLSGNITGDVLSSLTQLTRLELGSNAFTGTLPGGILAQLTNLELLDLGFNSFQGPVPSELGTLGGSLTALLLNNNALAGQLPPSLASLSALAVLRLDGNLLSGSIPAWLANFSQITSFGISGNLWTGEIPAFLLSYPVLDASGAVLPPFFVPAAAPPVTVCTAGTYQDGSITSVIGSSYYPAPACAPCSVGTVAPTSGASSCVPCAAGLYWSGDGVSCLPCPLGSTSPGGSTIEGCACTFGFFPDWSSGTSNASFVCAACPIGALCTGAGMPLALAGFWHLPGDRTRFYPCVAGFCVAENSTSGASATTTTARRRSLLQEGMGGAEEEIGNCRVGQQGLLCAECVHGWQFQGQFCGPCQESQSILHWPRWKRALLCFFLLAVFLCVGLPVLLLPLFPELTTKLRDVSVRAGDRVRALATRSRHLIIAAETDALESHSPSESKTAAPPPAGRRFGKYNVRRLVPNVIAFVRYMVEPGRILLDTIQIVSSFKRTIRVSWPVIFRRVLARLQIFNLNFLELPTVACSLAPANYYRSFNGTTCGVAATIAFAMLVWTGGRIYARVRKLPSEVVNKFDGLVTARIIFFCDIMYAPVSEQVVSIFACTRVGSALYLVDEPSIQCYTEMHWRYLRLGIFWLLVYPIGIPVFYYILLLYFRIPQGAAQLEEAAALRQLVDLAWQRGVKQPRDVVTSLLTVDQLTDEHVTVLYEGVLLRHREHKQKAVADEKADADEELAAEAEETEQAAAAAAAMEAEASAGKAGLSRDEKLALLLKWSRSRARPTPLSWRELHGIKDCRRPNSERIIGHLYESYYPQAWGWKLFELLNKFVLTSVLLFIKTGTPAQVLAGVTLSFCSLLIYLRVCESAPARPAAACLRLCPSDYPLSAAVPHALRAVREIAYCSSVVVFLFFFIALLIKVNVQLTADDATAFSAFVSLAMLLQLCGPIIILYKNRVVHNIIYNRPLE